MGCARGREAEAAADDRGNEDEEGRDETRRKPDAGLLGRHVERTCHGGRHPRAPKDPQHVVRGRCARPGNQHCAEHAVTLAHSHHFSFFSLPFPFFVKLLPTIFHISENQPLFDPFFPFSNPACRSEAVHRHRAFFLPPISFPQSPQLLHTLPDTMRGFFDPPVSSQNAVAAQQAPSTVPTAALLRMRACFALRTLGVFFYAWAACLALSLIRSPFHGCKLHIHTMRFLFPSLISSSTQSTFSLELFGATRFLQPHA